MEKALKNYIHGLSEQSCIKNNLESYVKGQGMTWRTKIKVMITVTLLMAFGFFMMIRKDLYIPCAILSCVWVFHIVYFIFGVKTFKPCKMCAARLQNKA